MIYALNGVEWDRLWTSYTAEYNPIWNVDGTDTIKEERDLTQVHTGTDKYADSGNDKLVRSGKDSQTIQNSTWAFDSSSNVNTDKSVTDIEPGTTDTTTYGKTNTETRDLNDTDKGTVTTTHTRGGNIGVTMTQQMLEADLEYWSKAAARFYERVCMDIVDRITYKIYTESDESNTESSSSESTSNITITPVLTSGVVIATVTTED